MIVLAALHNMEMISQSPYQFPIWGLIALILAILAYLSLLLDKTVKNMSEEFGRLLRWLAAISWIVSTGISIYGIFTGLISPALFIIALVMTSLLALLIVSNMIRIILALRGVWNPKYEKKKHRR